MESIGHLLSLGSTLAGPLGVSATSIAGNHLDGGVLTEPGRRRLSRSIGQNIHRLMGLQVHDHRPIALAFFPRPIINTDDRQGSRSADAGEWVGADSMVAGACRTMLSG